MTDANEAALKPTAGTFDTPVIPANQSLPEITLRGILIGTLLTIVLAAANAFLGLKMGQTISASIPAAIISMSILRFCRNSNILENTMVQTMASVGESLIAGVTFVMPALVILHVWSGFPYWETVGIALIGGTLGVLFTIPLRRALLQDRTLRYPEGVAISNVLKASVDKKDGDMKALAWGGIVGALISLFQTGFEILTDTVNYWAHTARTIVGFQLGLSPALIAAGYIVGINVAISFIVGICIAWLAGIPLLAWHYGVAANTPATDIAMEMWSKHIRLIGVGTMLVGGLWTLCTLMKPIAQSILASLTALRTARLTGVQPTLLRTERDIPINYVMWSVFILLVPLFLLLTYSIAPTNITFNGHFRLLLCGFISLYVIIGGFLICSMSAYFAGLIGSSNSPGSGMLISFLLLLCLLMLGFFHFIGGIDGRETFGVILAIGSSAVACAAITISNDTMQDLKVGQVVGATPWKQQAMLVLGVLVTAFVVPPIMSLLYNAYGMGGVFPHPGMNPAQMLPAPQAGMMATVANGVFTHVLEWKMIIIGMGIALVCIFSDEILRKNWNTRLPVLAVGLGIYLPMNTTIPVIIGGALSWIIQIRLNRLYKKGNAQQREANASGHRHRGLLLSCGIVAGASIMGVILAIPFVIKQSSDALKIMPDALDYLSAPLSIAVITAMCIWIYWVVMKKT